MVQRAHRAHAGQLQICDGALLLYVLAFRRQKGRLVVFGLFSSHQFFVFIYIVSSGCWVIAHQSSSSFIFSVFVPNENIEGNKFSITIRFPVELNNPDCGWWHLSLSLSQNIRVLRSFWWFTQTRRHVIVDNCCATLVKRQKCISNINYCAWRCSSHAIAQSFGRRTNRA